MKGDEKEGDIFELTDSEHILNLDFYLHRAILKWQDALESALKQGENIDTGLINRGLAGDMVEGIAKAMDLVHWEEQPEPEEEGKQKEKINKWNKEAKEFQEKYKKFKDEIYKMDIPSNIKKVKCSDFKVFEVMKKIAKKSTKKGTIIV